MDVIESCLALVPVPYISTAISIFRVIWTSVQQVQASNEQLRILSHTIAQLLQTLDKEYRQKRLVQTHTSAQLAELDSLLQEIARYVKKQSKENFLKLLFIKDERIACIDGYHRRIAALVGAFQISALLDIQKWQSRSDNAREKDQRLLNDHLLKNQKKLIEQMESQHSNLAAMIVSLQRKLGQQSTVDQERLFFSHSLTSLSTLSGRQIQAEDWMITSYEVDFIEEIGSGGFGQVFRGTWSKTEVGLKVLKAGSGISPSSEAIVREIKVWSKLRHPHILQFLGANVLDDKPFIVMPYMKNGNAHDYVQSHPDTNRIQLLHDISRGLNYLHSKNVIHGDLKAMNVLLDDNARAVICDFGLSRLKADASSRTARPIDSIVTGSRNWMAPERVLGGSLHKPADIYAFGMTIYEIYTNEIPLGHIDYADFVELVARGDVRPERPDDADALGLSDKIWSTAECCWAKDPLHRPDSTVLCDEMSHLISTAAPAVRAVADSARRKNTSSPIREQASRRISDVSHQAKVTSLLEVPPSPSQSLKPPTSWFRRASDPPPPKPGSLVDAMPSQLRRSLVDSCFILGRPGPLKNTNSPLRSIAVSPDWKQVASGSDDGIVRVWDTETNRSRQLKEQTGSSVKCVAFSPNGKRLVVGSFDQSVRIWNLGTEVCRQLIGHSGSVDSVAFAPDGRRIVSGSYDDTIRVWDVETGISQQLLGHTGNVAAVTFSPDSKQVASGSWDRTVRIWDTATGVSQSLSGHKLWVRVVAWSPDGRYFASGSEDSTICVWDMRTGSARTFSGHTHWVQTLTFSPDGKYLASGSRDCTVLVFDTKTGRVVVGPLKGHNRVRCVAFSLDGRHMLSACNGGLVRVWSV